MIRMPNPPCTIAFFSVLDMRSSHALCVDNLPILLVTLVATANTEPAKQLEAEDRLKESAREQRRKEVRAQPAIDASGMMDEKHVKSQTPRAITPMSTPLKDIRCVCQLSSRVIGSSSLSIIGRLVKISVRDVLAKPHASHSSLKKRNSICSSLFLSDGHFKPSVGARASFNSGKGSSLIEIQIMDIRDFWMQAANLEEGSILRVSNLCPTVRTDQTRGWPVLSPIILQGLLHLTSSLIYFF